VRVSAAAAIHALFGLKAVESAALVNERSGIWSEYRSPKPGKRKPGERKIQAWIDRLAEQGHPIRLDRTAGGCVAVSLGESAPQG